MSHQTDTMCVPHNREPLTPAPSDVAEGMDCDPSSARRYVAVLLDLDKLARVWVRATNDKPAHYQFSIGKDTTTVIVPAFAPRTNNPRYSQQDHEHQATVPARQIGMGRDPLVAALFGQAGVS